MKDKTYDILKTICTIVLPALGALYTALAAIWNLPYVDAIVGTLAAIATFIGALIGISSKNYWEEQEK